MIITKERRKQMERQLTILLVEDEQDVCQRITDEIDKTNDLTLISITNNSYRALELVKDYTPDVVILDLELHYGQGNGLEFLQELRNSPPAILPFLLVTTNNSSPTTYRFARELGVDFIMYKHQNDYSEKKVIDFLKMMHTTIQTNQKKQNPPHTISEKPIQKTQRLRRIISKELNYVGISPKSVGYKYLTDAILLSIENANDTEKQPHLSTIISKKYKKTVASIERGMQNAINRAWCTADIEDLLLHYTAKINSSKGVPTLTEFICYYANKIQNEH